MITNPECLIEGIFEREKKMYPKQNNYLTCI